MGNEMAVDIIIPVWNQLEVTRECLDSIFRHTPDPHRCILVDNASDDATAKYLEGIAATRSSEVLLIRNTVNLGFVKAVNQGIAASDAEMVCIMNNDTIVTAGWLTEMVSVMAESPELGLINPSSNTSGQFPLEGESVDDCASRLHAESGGIQELYTCRGFCMLVRRKVIDDLGMLDEIYHLGYFDDTDYCKRAQAAGYRTARAKGAYVYHKENTTFKTLDDNSELFRRNERVFFERWGRHVRVAYFLTDAAAAAKADEVATEVARAGHQIYLFTKAGRAWPVRLDHFDIRRIDVSAKFFSISSFFKVLRRRRKKPFEILLTDDRIFGVLLRATRGLHGADVLTEIDAPALMERLAERSRIL